MLRRKKFEIATDEVGNFIKQDEKKGVLREVIMILSSTILVILPNILFK